MRIFGEHEKLEDLSSSLSKEVICMGTKFNYGVQNSFISELKASFLTQSFLIRPDTQY